MTPPHHTTWIIGSAADCDIRVTSPYVSARHCRLSFDGQNWLIEDLGSTNGTFVQGRRITTATAVSPTDDVTLGTTAVFPWPSAPSATPPASDATLPVKLGRRPLVIGRSLQCHIVLDIPMVSGRHAVLEPDGDAWRIRDLGSTNGTFVRGRRIDGPARVTAGEVIGLGSCRLRLEEHGARVVNRGPARQAALEAQEITVAGGGRRLIERITLAVMPGEVVGLMGTSGAGKSTLLAALVGAQPPEQGVVLVGGVDLYARYDEFRGQIGYVPQDDIMHAELTVSQALWYAARLRLPRDYSDDEIRCRIAAVVDQLGLGGSEHVRIGSADQRGISGGQRKRVNVAMELVTDPPLLVLDEPTSGLSSVDALALVTLLRTLADAGRTILLSIHQPGVEMLRQMDGLAVMARDASTLEVGQLAWYGPPFPDAARFFEPRGRPDDADAILRGLTARSVADWVAHYRRSSTYRDWIDGRRTHAAGHSSPLDRRQVSLLDGFSQWRTLVGRSLAIKTADRWTTAILLLQAPVIGLLVALVFGHRASAPVNHDTWGDTTRAVATTMFLLALAAIWFGCSNAAREIVAERAILRRERMVGLSLTAYMSAKLVVLAGLAAVQCGILLAFVIPACGLGAPPGSTWFTLFLAANVATLIGLCVSAVARSAETAASVLPLVLLPMVILGGILLPVAALPRPTSVLADAMPSRWAFEALLVSEADARPTLELPAAESADLPGHPLVEDFAEPWFPRAGHRARKATPLLMLAGMWLLGAVALRLLLQRAEGRRGIAAR